MLFDSHAHIDDEKFAGEQALVVQRAVDNGVTRLINVGSDIESSAKSVELAEEYSQIWAAVGIHPHEAEKVSEGDYDKLIEWSKLPRVVAIGEIGLDYYYDLSPRDVQKMVFIRQLRLARQCDLPVIIHDRDAHGDTLAIIKNEGRGVRGVVHCFAGSWEMAQELLKLGWYIGVDGPVTFKNAAKLPEVIKKIPLERLLIETDSPYLTPVPLRGRRNEPAYVKYVAEHVAKLRGIETAEFARMTTHNACTLFGIK